MRSVCVALIIACALVQGPGHAAPEQEPWLAAYVHMGHCFDPAAPVAEREAAIAAVLDDMKRSGLRVVMPYATTSDGKALYPSAIIPDRSYGDWDPLAVFVRESRKRGLRVWPAVGVLVCGHDKPAGILAQHPEWALVDAEGQPMGYISAGAAPARQWILSVLEEIVTRYQPDGVLLDYLRYPNKPAEFDPATRIRFLAESGRDAYDISDRLDDTLQAFKERCLTELMGMIHQRMHSVAPDLKLALYTWGPHVTQNHYVAQHWPVWVERGWLDVLNVSGYYYPARYGDAYLDEFRASLRKARELTSRSEHPLQLSFALGVKTSHGELDSAEAIGAYLQAARSENVSGVALFTLSYLQPYLDAFIQGGYLDIAAQE